MQMEDASINVFLFIKKEMNNMNINFNEWIKKYEDFLNCFNRFCDLNSKFDKNKSSSAICVMKNSMQDINLYFENNNQTTADLCFLIRNIDVCITSILDLNNILCHVGLNKQDKALEKCFRNYKIIHDFRTLRSLILAHPVDTNYINEDGVQETVYLEDIHQKSSIDVILKLEEHDFIMRLCSPSTQISYFKPLIIKKDIIPVITEIIDGIELLTNKLAILIKKEKETLRNIKLSICNDTIQEYIISLDKELQKRYPSKTEKIEYKNKTTEYHSIIYDCLLYVNASFSKATQIQYDKFLNYIKAELFCIEKDLQDMTYDITEDSYFSLCYNNDFAKNEDYAKEKMVYLCKSNKTSFTTNEIPNTTTSNILWGIQQFKKLMPYIKQYIPVDTNVSDKELYCEYIAAVYLSNIEKGK